VGDTEVIALIGYGAITGEHALAAGRLAGLLRNWGLRLR